MINNPKVTRAIPAYKSDFLKEAIESVLNQTYRNIELHIVNDCSPQDIDSIVRYFDFDNRLYYHKNEYNIGGKDPVANWNKCLSYATGDFFSLLCDDDVYAPTFVEEMLKLADKYPKTNVFRTRVKIVDKDNRLKNFYPSSPEWESSIDYMWSIVSGYRLQTISEFMYRTEHIRKNGGYISLPKAWCSDYVSVINLSKNGGIATSNKLLAHFRASGINISTGNSKNIREKVNAQVLYTKLIEKFLIDQTEEIRELILRIRKEKIRSIMSQYLVYANWKDFIFLYLNHRTKDYEIPSRCFMKAIYGKLAKILKRQD